MKLLTQLLRFFQKQEVSTPVAPAESTDSNTPTEQLEQVIFDAERIVRTMLDGGKESVLWADLNEVRVITTDEGPFVQDVYFLLIGETSGCAVPSNASGADALLTRLQALPGFDNSAFIESMSSTENAEFICWKRDPDAAA